jgi:hypothetical protein
MGPLIAIPADIRRKVHAATIDVVIGALADVQHGVVARWQLIELGYAENAIQRRINCGRLRRIHRGVYAVGHRNLTPNGYGMAAVLACGPNAFLSHRTAADHRHMRRSGQARPDVTLVGTGRRRHRGINVHVTRDLDPEDVTRLNGIPVAAVPRILLDLATILTVDQLIRVIEQAERMEVFDLWAIDRAIARTPTRNGVRKLQQAVKAYRPTPFTRSDFERDFWAVLRDLDLPAYAINQNVAGHDVDVWFPDSRLVIVAQRPGARRRDRVQRDATAACYARFARRG